MFRRLLFCIMINSELISLPKKILSLSEKLEFLRDGDNEEKLEEDEALIRIG
jgi:hypothetical protein